MAILKAHSKTLSLTESFCKDNRTDAGRLASNELLMKHYAARQNELTFKTLKLTILFPGRCL